MRYCWLIALALLVSSSPSRASADESELVQKAFATWVKRAGIATADGILTAQIPCGEELCLQFTMDPVVREHAMPRVAELMAGFGFGADVVSANLVTDRTHLDQATLTLLTLDSKGQTPAAQRIRTASNYVALLKMLAGLNRGDGKPSKPQDMPPESAFYFIAGVATGPTNSTVTLLAPPRAPMPSLPQRLDGEGPCFCKPHLAARQPVAAGKLAQWQAFELRCNWVCTAAANPIE
jgi:hypothetical protein